MTTNHTLDVDLRVDGIRVGLLSDDALPTQLGAATAPPLAGRIVLDQDRAAHEDDTHGAGDAQQACQGTTVLLHEAQRLTCWGLPANTPVHVPLGQPVTLRLDLTNSPFAYRPVSVELQVADGQLSTRTSQGPADLVVSADWAAALAWMSQPSTLFADAFPGTVRLRGEIAVLSLFEGALWRATRDWDPAFSGVLLRWTQFWPTGGVRQALRQVQHPGSST
ncbi:MAG: hypothetical protein U0P45_11775 [Acidimicrobiales bacterium]